jgi:tetratricopeptide (TPR) repeat protein
MENSDIDSTIALYKKAIEVNPTHEVAWFNLGVLYYNMGVKLNLKAKSVSNPDSSVYYNKEAQLKYENALPFLQKAFEINPNSAETIHALKQICLKTYRYEEYDLYDELEKKLRTK